MLHYAIYARKSSERREETEKSVEEQVAACQVVAQQMDLVVVREDRESMSAKKPKLRPLFTELLRRIEQGEVNALLCWKVNRLARNMEEGGKLTQLLIDGVLQEIRTPFEVFRPGDNIMPLVLETATSTQYSLDLRQNVQRGLKGHFQSGGVNYKAPIGYLNARHPVNQKIGVIIPDPERFALVRKGWEMLLTGAYTPAQVAQNLNDVWSFRTRQTVYTGGKPLSHSRAYTLFRDPFYAGYVRYAGQIIKGQHEPMVSESEFAQVQTLLDRHSRKKTPMTEERQPTQDSGRRRNFAFTGLMRCGHCASQITAEYHILKNGMPYIFYRCSDAKGTCSKKGISERLVDQEILRRLDSLTIEPDLSDQARDAIIQYLESDTEAQETIYRQQQATLADLEKQLSNLVTMWLKGLITDEARYREMEADLNRQKQSLLLVTAQSRDELSAARSNAVASCQYLKFARNCFLAGSVKEKREIASALCLFYKFYGPERRLEMEVHPLLVQTVRFAHSLRKERKQFKGTVSSIAVGKGGFEPGKIGSGRGKLITYRVPILSGRTTETTVEQSKLHKAFSKVQEALLRGGFPAPSFCGGES